MNWKIVATAALIAGSSAQALAQAQGGSVPAQPSASNPDSMAAARNAREQQEGYNRIVNEGVKVRIGEDDRGGEPLAESRGPVPATAADIVAGAALRDKSGVQIAMIERLEADGAVVRTGDRLAKLPLDAFGKDDAGLMLGITAAEFQAAIAQTSVPVPSEEPQVVAATAADVTPGAAVRDSEGVAIGTVQELAADGVIILTDGKKVKLELDSFGKDANGLMIGITATEFRAIIHNPRPASSAG